MYDVHTTPHHTSAGEIEFGVYQRLSRKPEEQKNNEPVLILRALWSSSTTTRVHEREFDHTEVASQRFEHRSCAIIHLSRVDLGAILHYIVTVSMVLSENDNRTCRQLLDCPNPLEFMTTMLTTRGVSVLRCATWSCVETFRRTTCASRSTAA